MSPPPLLVVILADELTFFPVQNVFHVKCVLSHKVNSLQLCDVNVHSSTSLQCQPKIMINHQR